MDISDNKLREFENTIREIRDAALSGASLFADREFRKVVVWLSYGFGAAIAVFCAMGHAIIAGSAGPSTTSAIIWAFVVIVVLGAFLKIRVFSKIMRRRNKTIISLMRIVYGRDPLSVLIAAAAAIVGSSAFFISRDSGTLAISYAAIFISFGVFALNTRIRLPEFMTLGWFLLVGGLISLFFIESAPWLWGGIVWGGAFFALGTASLVLTRKR